MGPTRISRLGALASVRDVSSASRVEALRRRDDDMLLTARVLGLQASYSAPKKDKMRCRYVFAASSLLRVIGSSFNTLPCGRAFWRASVLQALARS